MELKKLLVVLCATFSLVAADIEWIPGERQEVDSSISHVLDKSPPQSLAEDDLRIQQLAYLLKSQELAAEMKRAAAAAAIEAARIDGERSFLKGSDPNADFTFAVGPGDPRFYGESGSSIQKIPLPDDQGLFVMDDFGVDEDVSDKSNQEGSAQSIIQIPINQDHDGIAPLTFIAIVVACCSAGVVAIIILGIVSYKLQKNAKAAADVEYPAYGVTGPNKDISPSSADKRLAQSAQMYHYQHQKQQIIAMERASNDRQGSISEPESEDDNEEGDYTVYECPGLASTGEMEVKNPLFQDDPTPASPANQPADACAGRPQELPK